VRHGQPNAIAVKLIPAMGARPTGCGTDADLAAVKPPGCSAFHHCLSSNA
jgi:hypothetical protein